jgi:starch synthase
MSSPRILFVTPEFDDFVQVGGLAAVSAALPRALRRFSDIRVVIPGYPQVLSHCAHMQIVGSCRPLAGLPACSVGRLDTPDGLAVYVVLCPALYEREGSPYCDPRGRDWSDNDIRFARFSAAAADLAAGLLDRDWAADLVHINDWPSALVPAYLAWSGRQIPTILTIHNLAYQGLFSREVLARIGGPQNAYTHEGMEFYDKVSFLKAGIVYASHVTTVSETYAREIATQEYGCGLDGLLRLRASQNRLTGILNGIDESWDPRTCGDLVSRFEAGDWKGKRENADYVRRKFGLALSRGPLFGLVARLVHQKGVDLVLSAAEAIVAAGGQIVVKRRRAPGDGVEEHQPPLSGFNWRGDRVRRWRGASHFCWQRLHLHAVALRTVRAQPNVRTAFRFSADRASNRRPVRDDRGRKNRIPVPGRLSGSLLRRRLPSLFYVRIQGEAEHNAAQRDGSGVQLG